jgi:hypothetical protein
MDKKTVLLLSLVHPDFLPPVYAIAQVLRDLDYHIHILTFDSFVPAEINVGPNIIIEPLGKHYNSGTFERWSLRRKFGRRAKQLAAESSAIISFCPFSFTCGLAVKGSVPIAYLALEIADFKPGTFLRSPLSNYRNLKALKNAGKADFIATPSLQRSAWLAGRCHLEATPFTILNTAYVTANKKVNSEEIFGELVPSEFIHKKIVLYTGAVNDSHCLLELVQAFDLVNDEDSALIITGIKENTYCTALEDFAAKSKAKNRILLFPYLTRTQMLSLQSNAHIGICFEKELENNIKSKMIAPNKVGEYLSNELYVVGLMSDYMRPLKTAGVASLSEDTFPEHISTTLTEALATVKEEKYKPIIRNFVESFFCMQQQAKPLVDFLTKVQSTGQITLTK